MEKNSIQYIALDMDGTILYQDYTISPAVIDALQRQKLSGRKIILATGRVRASALKHAHKFGGADGYICSNGADVYAADGRRIAKRHIEEPVSRLLVELARQTTSHFHAFIEDDWYYEKEKPYTKFYHRRSGLEGRPTNFDNFNVLTFTKFMFLDDHEKLEPIKSKIESEFSTALQAMYSAPFMLEVVARGVDKAEGLRAFLDFEGASLSEVCAFGDAENDLDMLQAVGIGVAMGNAPKPVKEAVRYHTLSVDDDGVAVFLNTYLP